ncbi:hypothetical protein ACWCP6_15760 [Streptomyces sp. NPDC002004]
MAWNEWEQLKATAAQGHSSRMQLKQLPVDPGGSGGSGGSGGPNGGWEPDLASSPAEMQTAANAIHDRIEGTRKAGRWADDDTDDAVKAFGPKDGDGWLTAAAIKKAHKTWGDQVQNLLTQLASERAGVCGTNKVLTGTDGETGLKVRASSPLDNC